MRASEARALARAWSIDRFGQDPTVLGVVTHGSINWLSDLDLVSPWSDVDLLAVMDDSAACWPRQVLRLEEFWLDVSPVSWSEVRDAVNVLARYDLAPSFGRGQVLFDRAGDVNQLAAEVRRHYGDAAWVRCRCDDALARMQRYLSQATPDARFLEQTMALVFAAGVATHVLLTAAGYNPTVRNRYVAVRDLLVERGDMASHERLLALLGAEALTPGRVIAHLDNLAAMLDAANAVVRTPQPFLASIGVAGREATLSGSRALIEGGLHREVVFWIAVQAFRCKTVIDLDAPVRVRQRFAGPIASLCSDLRLLDDSARRERREAVRMSLSWVRSLALSLAPAHYERLASP